MDHRELAVVGSKCLPARLPTGQGSLGNSEVRKDLSEEVSSIDCYIMVNCGFGRVTLLNHRIIFPWFFRAKQSMGCNFSFVFPILVAGC